MNTVVQSGELRNVGCPVPGEVKCNYYICNEVAPVCPTQCVGDISGQAASSIKISKGIGGRRGAVASVTNLLRPQHKKNKIGFGVNRQVPVLLKDDKINFKLNKFNEKVCIRKIT